MKNMNEKKQDLLLNALSCIDDDILEKGLALREGMKSAASQDTSTEQARRESSANSYLFELTKPSKPRKNNSWRATAIVAAACLLFCVIPLSVWMVASFGMDFFLPDKSEEAVQDTIGELNGINSEAVTREESVGAELPKDEGNTSEINLPDEEVNSSADTPPSEEADSSADIFPDREETVPESLPFNEEAEKPEDVFPAPGDPQETNNAETDRSESPPDTEADAPQEPTEDATEEETAQEANGMVWTTGMNTNQLFGYTGVSSRGKTVRMIGTVEMEGKPIGQTVSPEDELVLKLVGQWMLSVYTLDYDIHFTLFPEEVIAEYILPSFEEAGLTYAQALEKIHRTANDTYGLQSLALSLHLRSNELLTGDDLVAYQKKLTRDYPELANTNAVTAVRKIQFSETNQVIPDEHFWVDPMDVITTFYAYEYNGRWYLDTEICLEDDLCIDLLAADPESSPWYKTKTWTGTVSVLNEDYLIMDGLALRIGEVPLPDGIKVGDTVTVTYHGLGATFLTEESDGLIQTPEPEVSVYKLDRIDHVVEKDL